MPDHFQVIVIGSGFGGSVAAYRLAAGGLRICLLERGRSYPPGSFARSPREVRGNFWDPSEGLHGLFNVWSFRGIDVVVSSGVGGGSLIYANVLMRMPPTWFKTRIWDGPRDAYEDWPIGYDDLKDHSLLVLIQRSGPTRSGPWRVRPRSRRAVWMASAAR